jgi:hypothetical protein
VFLTKIIIFHYCLYIYLCFLFTRW